jgi:hypothetical protein
VNGYHPDKAGLALLPLLLTLPVANAISGILTTKFKVSPTYVILTGSCLQCIGVGLLLHLPAKGGQFPTEQYAYESLMGIGFGFIMTTLMTMTLKLVAKKDFGKQIIPNIKRSAVVAKVAPL